MQKISYAFFGPLLLMLATLAQAQTAGTITFTANKKTASGSLIPVLTWSTSPVATSCTASGGWSGTKFASGSETLAKITSSKSYTLTCTWGSGSTTLRWTAPTKNSNGSTLTDLAGYKVVYGRSATSLTQSKSVTDPKATSTSIGSLAVGTWYFAVRSVNSRKVESKNSSRRDQDHQGRQRREELFDHDHTHIARVLLDLNPRLRCAVREWRTGARSGSGQGRPWRQVQHQVSGSDGLLPGAA